jgi:hypothetical protein
MRGPIGDAVGWAPAAGLDAPALAVLRSRHAAGSWVTGSPSPPGPAGPTTVRPRCAHAVRPAWPRAWDRRRELARDPQRQRLDPSPPAPRMAGGRQLIHRGAPRVEVGRDRRRPSRTAGAVWQGRGPPRRSGLARARPHRAPPAARPHIAVHDAGRALDAGLQPVLDGGSGLCRVSRSPSEPGG